MLDVTEAVIATPIGSLELLATGDALIGIHFVRGSGTRRSGSAHPVLDQARQELEEYFAGRRKTFSVRLSAAGTAFQQQVWKALSEIPYARRCSYADLARSIGRPRAVRAVGSANGRNPLPIIVPCHRVIASDGTLGGYGGGLPIKEWLLNHEAKLA